MKRNLFFCLLVPAVAFISCTASKSSMLNHLSKKEKKQGYTLLFDGKTMDQWTGNTQSYVPEDGTITIHPEKGSGGNVYTKQEYSDFDFLFSMISFKTKIEWIQEAKWSGLH